MFLSLLLIVFAVAYVVACIGAIVFPLFMMRNDGDTDTFVFGSFFVILGVMGLLLALAVVTGEISFNSDTPKEGCWRVTTSQQMVGKTMTDVRHWESIRCP